MSATSFVSELMTEPSLQEKLASGMDPVELAETRGHSMTEDDFDTALKAQLETALEGDDEIPTYDFDYTDLSCGGSECSTSA